MEWKGQGRKRSSPNFIHYNGICMGKGLTKAMMEMISFFGTYVTTCKTAWCRSHTRHHHCENLNHSLNHWWTQKSKSAKMIQLYRRPWNVANIVNIDRLMWLQYPRSFPLGLCEIALTETSLLPARCHLTRDFGTTHTNTNHLQIIK
jgi:hypothetical protein